MKKKEVGWITGRITGLSSIKYWDSSADTSNACTVKYGQSLVLRAVSCGWKGNSSRTGVF